MELIWKPPKESKPEKFKLIFKKYIAVELGLLSSLILNNSVNSGKKGFSKWYIANEWTEVNVFLKLYGEFDFLGNTNREFDPFTTKDWLSCHNSKHAWFGWNLYMNSIIFVTAYCA